MRLSFEKSRRNKKVKSSVSVGRGVFLSFLAILFHGGFDGLLENAITS